MKHVIRMRTTLDIPEDLLNEAMATLEYKSKTDTIIYALRELIRAQRRELLKGLAGKVAVTHDAASSRRRPRGAR